MFFAVSSRIARAPAICALLAASCLLDASSATPADPDMVFTSRHTWYNARLAGMASSGCAVPENISATLVNPALPHGFSLLYGLKGIMAFAAYGKGDVFAQHVLPAGAALSGPEFGTLGVLGRFLRASADQSEYEGILSYSSRLFPKSMGQGPVDYGINIRLERQNWRTSGFDTLFATHHRVNAAGAIDRVHADTLGSSVWDQGHLMETRLALDAGFFQASIAEALDFGLVLHNIVGYTWRRELPDIGFTSEYQESIFVRGPDTLRPDTGFTQAPRYESRYAETNEWLPNWYRGVTAGIAYHTSLMDGKLEILLPLDIELVGLFDRPRGMLFMLRTGVEVGILESYYLRFGYARQPERMGRFETRPKNDNLFFGGAGARISGIMLDFYLGRNQWGLGAGVTY